MLRRMLDHSKVVSFTCQYLVSRAPLDYSRYSLPDMIAEQVSRINHEKARGQGWPSHLQPTARSKSQWAQYVAPTRLRNPVSFDSNVLLSHPTCGLLVMERVIGVVQAFRSSIERIVTKATPIVAQTRCGTHDLAIPQHFHSWLSDHP